MLKKRNVIPATIPKVSTKDGIEYISFFYSVKGHSQEYTIRTDILDLLDEEIPPFFKHDNCVYPKADVPKAEYTGNRFDYENR